MPVLGITRRIGINNGSTKRSKVCLIGWKGDMKYVNTTSIITTQVSTVAVS